MALGGTPGGAPDRTAQLVSRAFLFLGAAGVIVGLGLLILFGTASPGPGFIGVSALLLIVFAFLEPDTVRDFASQGYLRSSVRAVLGAVLVVAAVILINATVKAKLADKTVDLSKGHVNSLAPQTVQLLQRINQPLKATVWYGQNLTEMQTAIDLLHRYHDINSQFTVQSFSVLERPQLAQQQKVEQTNSVVFEYQNRAPEVTTQTSEQGFTTTLLRLVTGRTPKVYFLTGHGEGTLTVQASGGASYSGLKLSLNNQGISSASLNLLAGASSGAIGGLASPSPAESPSPDASPAPSAVAPVPADADEVVIMDPQAPLGKDEIAALQSYLDGGGHVLVDTRPFSKSNLNDLVSKYGAAFGTGVVLDPQMKFRGNIAVLLVQDYGTSPVSHGMAGRPVIIDLATPVLNKAPGNFQIAPVISTKSDACERTDINDQSGQCQPAEKKGPFSVMVSIENAKPKPEAHVTRLVLAGISDTASDQVSQSTLIQGNFNTSIMVNAINWLAGQDIAVNIPVRDVQPDTVFLTNPQRQLILYGYPLFMPLLVGAIGVSVYMRRRRTV